MVRDCFLNELSFRDVSEHTQGLPELVAALWDLSHLPGANTTLRACGRLEDPGTAAGEGFAACKSAVLRLPRNHPLRLRALRLFTSLGRFAPDMTSDTKHDGRRAWGLGYAHGLGGLALSLDLPRWRVPWLEVQRDRLSGDAIVAEQVRVRHASETAHLSEHGDWYSQLPEVDRLRILRELFGYRPTPASAYSRGKHVQGKDDAERRESACAPGAPGQYRAVSDAVIAAWERAAFDAILKGDGASRGRVEHKGGDLYYVFCELDHVVGFASGGAETRCVRVEWKRGEVHSHPRPLSDMMSPR